MYRILTASKDTYITNKIIDNDYRATDANVGQAGTLDLFKLYDEAVSGSDTSPTELTRLLIKFDLAPLTAMHNDGLVDITDSTFKTYVKLHDIYGGQTTPTNFDAILFPLSKSFDEGSGYDVGQFNDIDNANWLTSSFPAVGSASAAAATLTVIDGDANSGMSEKQALILTSTDGTEKTYVIVDDEETAVATGDVLESDSDTGDGSTAGDALVGGIAVAINLTGGSVSSQNDFLVQLRAAIVHANGHNGKITVSAVPSEADGNQSITLTQATTGYIGNRSIVNGMTNLAIASEFTGGTGGAQIWHLQGALKSGSLNDENIDVITSGTISGQLFSRALNTIQHFETGEEDLFMDVTTVVSATIKNLIEDHGFLIALSGTYEKNQKSYYVKRFASRHVKNTALRPKLIVKYDDSIQDNHEDFIFGVTGSLYLHNFHRGNLANIVTNTAGGTLTDGNCMKLKLVTGTFREIFDVSQILVGSNRRTGIYSTSFAINQFNARTGSAAVALSKHIEKSGSIVFDEIWTNTGETITFLSSSIEINLPDTNQLFLDSQRLIVKVLNISDRYQIIDDALVRLRVFCESVDKNITFTKGPLEKKSEIFHEMYYRVRDFQSGEIIIPFDTEDKSTRLSTDSSGMYFDFYMNSLPLGRSYIFDFLVKRNNINTIIKDAASKFVVE